MSRFDDYGYEYIEVRISRTNHSRFCARWPNVRITFKTSEF